mmetsp:Transcript_126258/g.178171  ORF Transcript_126258/g.178171 Transcript_126258/m.178171 type:complete len:89 (+) Transcript_126258:53-319(+)
MFWRSPQVRGFFDNQFSRPGPLRTLRKQQGIAWVCAVFSLPTFLVLVGNHPDVQEWFIRHYRPIEYPPQSDPAIIYDIYHGRTPRKSA